MRSTLGRGTGFEASSGVERRLVKPQQFSAWNEILTSGKKRLVDAWQSHVGKDSSSFIQKAVFKNGHFPHAVLLIFPFKKINEFKKCPGREQSDRGCACGPDKLEEHWASVRCREQRLQRAWEATALLSRAQALRRCCYETDNLLPQQCLLVISL